MVNEYVWIGKIVNTHGIKGELKLLSDFEQKEKVFLPHTKIYIGDKKQEEEIKTYRRHKQFDMITLEGYININEVLHFKNQSVFVKRSTLQLQENEYVYQDLIGMEVVENEKVLGKIKDIVYNKANTLLYVEGTKKFYIPLISQYVKKVEVNKKKVVVEGGKDLML